MISPALASSTSGSTGSLTSSLSSSANASSGTSSNTSGNAYALTPSDFINLMVTQLKNQDPLSPASNSELLDQMSQIGQLQSSTDLQSTLKSVTLQTQVGSASALIGKTVTGINTNNKSVTGAVQSVSIAGNTVNLNLDSGDTVAVNNVSSITSPTTAGDVTATTTTTPSAAN